MFAQFLLAKQSNDLGTIQVLLKEEKGAGRMMLLGGSAGIKHLSFPVRALVTISFIPKESPCITTVFSKWKSLQQVSKGWEQFPGFRKWIIYPFPFPLMAVFALSFSFHQRGWQHWVSLPCEGCTELNLSKCQRTTAVTWWARPGVMPSAQGLSI